MILTTCHNQGIEGTSSSNRKFSKNISNKSFARFERDSNNDKLKKKNHGDHCYFFYNFFKYNIIPPVNLPIKC